MNRLHRIAPSLLILSLVLATAPVVAQNNSAQTDATQLFVERVDVNIVNVEVWVTDGEGRRVQGLEKDDFELLEDGVPVEISNFYAAAREKPYAEMLEGISQPAAEAEPSSETLPPDQTLYMVLLVDHFNTLPVNRNRALDELEPFLEDRIRQGDRVMLMGYNRTIDVVEPFTDDWSRVQEGLKRMSKASSQKVVREAERKRRMRAIKAAWENGDSASTAFDFVRGQVQQETQEIRQTGKALQNLVRSMAGMPGRKAIVYLSDGLPKRPGEALFQQYFDLFGRTAEMSDPFSQALRQDQAPLLNAITREANANQVTLYTVDARGSSGGSTLSSEHDDLSAGSGGSSSMAVARTLNYQETLIEIADATGGSAVLNTFNYDRAMTRVAEDFDVFYSLGYAARQGGDGKFHQIEVRVNQPGLKVRHRRGYLDKPQVERVADRTMSSLVLDMERNPLDVQIDFGVAEKKGKGAYHLPVMIRVPAERLTLLPNGEVEEGRLRIYMAVKDENGLSDMQEFPYAVSLPVGSSTSGDGREVGYAATLRIRPGTPTVAIGVWDELSGTDAFVHKQVRVGKGRG
jgi:VWFA-related protein